MNRRELAALLATAAANPAAVRAQLALVAVKPVRPEWLGQYSEPILQPALPIIDPHHHLWRNAIGHYLLDDLLADTSSGHDIIGTFYLQAGSVYRAAGPVEMKPLG